MHLIMMLFAHLCFQTTLSGLTELVIIKRLKYIQLTIIIINQATCEGSWLHWIQCFVSFLFFAFYYRFLCTQGRWGCSHLSQQSKSHSTQFQHCHFTMGKHANSTQKEFRHGDQICDHAAVWLATALPCCLLEWRTFTLPLQLCIALCGSIT